MTCPGCNAPLTDTHRCYDPADRVRARRAAQTRETERLREVARNALVDARAAVRQATTSEEIQG